MKAFLIDPWHKTISQIDYTDNWETICPTISAPGHKVSLFTTLAFSDCGDIVYLDDEGLLKPGLPCWHWDVDAPGRYYVGKGLVLGSDEEGETVEPSAQVTMAFLTSHVVFTDLETTGELEPSREGFVNHPILGRVPAIIGGQGIVRERTS